jgi:hypothetical protein
LAAKLRNWDVLLRSWGTWAAVSQIDAGRIRVRFDGARTKSSGGSGLTLKVVAAGSSWTTTAT